MKPHDTFLELAAIAMDFPLTSADRGRLEQHLAGCAACGRMAHELRGDALALSHLPPVTLPERRGAEILATALHPPVVRNPVRLVVVAALLGLLLLGSLAVGSELLRRMDDDDLGVVLPVPTQAASPDASPALATPSAPGPEPSMARSGPRRACRWSLVVRSGESRRWRRAARGSWRWGAGAWMMRASSWSGRQPMETRGSGCLRPKPSTRTCSFRQAARSSACSTWPPVALGSLPSGTPRDPTWKLRPGSHRTA